jgi:hypothetical protein
MEGTASLTASIAEQNNHGSNDQNHNHSFTAETHGISQTDTNTEHQSHEHLPNTASNRGQTSNCHNVTKNCLHARTQRISNDTHKMKYQTQIEIKIKMA